MHRRLNHPAFGLFVIQRLSGALLALMLLIHLATVIYAVHGGLNVAEIIARVRGNGFWIFFYGTFATAAIVHATIGLRNILNEWTATNRRVIDLVITIYAIGSIWLSFRAIEAIW